MKKCIYLNHASTCYPKPTVVKEAMCDYFDHIGISASRAGGSLAKKAEEIFTNARKKTANLFHVKQLHSIFFSLNATHAANIILQGFIKEKDHIIISAYEHNSIIRPLEFLKRTRNISYNIVWPRNNDCLYPEDFVPLIQQNTKLIITTHISNVTGSVIPIREIGEIAHKHKIAFFVDAAQSAGILDIDVEKNFIDFLIFTGHKHLLGPSGIGGGYINNPLLVESLLHGGTGSSSNSLIHPQAPPTRFEAGTENYLGIAGFLAGLKFIESYKIHNIYKKIKSLTEYCRNELKKLQKVKIFGSNENHISIVSFLLNHYTPAEISFFLEEKFKIITRPGIACAPYIHQALQTKNHGVVRVSFGHTNNFEDIDNLIYGLHQFIKYKENCL